MDKTPYAGIGSRSAPPDVLRDIYELGKELAQQGFTLRSGGADGCDSRFELGAKAGSGGMEIYLPWKGFNGNKSELYTYNSKIETIAREVYGARWSSLSSGAQKLMTRNVSQILGLDYSRSEFVICWTPDGCETSKKRGRKTGGTGQAIDLADIMGIPVFNMKNDSFAERFSKYLHNRK